MNKIILVAAIISTFYFRFSVSMAQDTISELPSCAIDDWPHDYHVEVLGGLSFDRTFIQYAKKYTAKNVNIVGIAAIAFVFKEDLKTYLATHPNYYDSQMNVMDTSYSDCYEWFRLSKRHIDTNDHSGDPHPTRTYDTLEILASGKMHVLDTNVIGYFDKAPYGYYEYNERYLPIRAVFFDSAVSVDDEFWVGRTQRTFARNDSLYSPNYGKFLTWGIKDAYITNNVRSGSVWDSVKYNSDTIFLETQYLPQHDTARFYDIAQWYHPIFPLFCELPVYPSPLVLEGSGGGSADVVPVLSASDFVVLSPNPAVTEVTVSSSTGVGRLRVYDVNGNVVYETRGEGLQHTIPVATWPAGVYVVHVDTPLGLAVKKFEKAK